MEESGDTLLGSLKTFALVISSILYVLFVLPLKALGGMRQDRDLGVFIVMQSSRGTVVQPRARSDVFQLALAWASRAGLKLTAQGHFLKSSLSKVDKGYILSLAVSLQSFFESRGFHVNVKLREVFGEDLVAVIEVKRKNILSRIRELIRPSRNLVNC